MTDAEQNYGVTDQEMLAVVASCKHWRHYVQGSRYEVEAWTDHANLRTFFASKELSSRQVRWWERLSGL